MIYDDLCVYDHTSVHLCIVYLHYMHLYFVLCVYLLYIYRHIIDIIQV